MKKIILLFLLPSFCFAQTSTISGNAYWHYNDYVGNKPDAGADVYLFTPDTSRHPQSTQCDVMGNFKFDNLQPGKYLVFIASYNTTDDGTFNFIPFDVYSGYNKYLGFDIKDNKAAYDSIALLDTAYIQSSRQKITMWNMNKRIKDQEIKRQALAAQKRRVIYLGAINSPFNCGIALVGLKTLSIQRRVHFKILSLEAGQNKTDIADFGTTYR